MKPLFNRTSAALILILSGLAVIVYHYPALAAGFALITLGGLLARK